MAQHCIACWRGLGWSSAQHLALMSGRSMWSHAFSSDLRASSYSAKLTGPPGPSNFAAVSS